MDFQKIECFLSVAHTLNFSRAAQQLYMAQSSVTGQIKTMEEELGYRLLERDRRGVRLTEAGRCLQKELTQIVATYTSAIQRARQISQKCGKHLLIGYPNPPEWGNMPLFLSAYRQQNPDVTLQLRLGKGRQLLELFQAGALDVMFGDLEYLRGLNAQVTPLFKTPSYVLIPHAHPLSGRKEIAPSEINVYKAFCLSNDIQDAALDTVAKRLVDAGIERASINPVKHREDVVASVYANMGLGIVPGTLEKSAYLVDAAVLKSDNMYFEFGCVSRKADDHALLDSFLSQAYAFSWIGSRI